MATGFSGPGGLSLPRLDGLSSAAAAALDDNLNYNLPSKAALKAEVAEKLNSSGMLSSFNRLSKDETITNANGQKTLTDPTTGKFIAVIGNSTSSSASAVSEIGEDNTNKFKVTISQDPALPGVNAVTFMVMPTIAESRSVSYKDFTPLHHPGQIFKYENTQSRNWSISAKLVSRTIKEATDNLQIINLIRSWTMPFYGNGTAADSNTKRYLGAPPPILTLSAYGDRMVGPVKCVLEQYSWDWPNDVDYIQTESRVPFPVIVSVSLTLKETWSPAEYSGFDLMQYRAGDMPKTYSAVAVKDAGESGDTARTARLANTDVEKTRQEATSVSTSQINAASDIRKLDKEILKDVSVMNKQQINGSSNMTYGVGRIYPDSK